MSDRGTEIINKRMDLKNLTDQAIAKQRDLKCLNEMIEKEKQELQYLEMMLKIDRAMDELNICPKDFRDSLTSREKLKMLYNDMSDKEIDILYDKLHDMK
jgi:hypothetical protein